MRLASLVLLLVLSPVGLASAQPASTAERQSTTPAVDCAALASPPAERACEGLADARAGRWAEAEASLETALGFAGDPAIDAQRAELEAALGEARAHLGSLDVRCTPAGATVSIDATARGVTPLLRPLRLLPGSHLARCALDDHEPIERTVDVTLGALAVLELTLTPVDHRPILERLGAPGEAQRIVGIGALTLGGVSLAVGLGTLFAGLDATAPGREPLFDVSRGTLIAAGALLVVGFVLVLTA